MIQDLVTRKGATKFITSSGGNAGYSVATGGKKAGIPVDVFVPSTTNPIMIDKIRKTGAKVVVAGNNWNEADAVAREELKKDLSAHYIPPFNDQRLWDGHASIVDEIVAAGIRPDTVILSVGGGGLLCGVQLGLARAGLSKTRILAVETEGAASFAAAKQNNRVVSLPRISTIATSLGALAVVPECLSSEIVTQSVVVSDRDAVDACYKFASDHKLLVEPACGAALSLLYDNSSKLRVSQTPTDSEGCVVVIVCGGNLCSVDLLSQWKRDYSLSEN